MNIKNCIWTFVFEKSIYSRSLGKPLNSHCYKSNNKSILDLNKKKKKSIHLLNKVKKRLCIQCKDEDIHCILYNCILLYNNCYTQLYTRLYIPPTVDRASDDLDLCSLHAKTFIISSQGTL